MVVALQVEHHAFAVCNLVAHVGIEHRRQRGQRHVTTQIEPCIRVLVVATGGAVETVVRILLQAVDAVAGRHVGGIAHQSCTLVVVLLGKDNLLAPVTDDIAHKGWARACASV